MTTEMEKVRDRLRGKLQREQKQLAIYDEYFEGRQPLRFLAPALEEQLGARLSPIVINLAMFSADVYDNRLDIEAFRYADKGVADDDLGDIFDDNDGDMLSQQAHRESLALGRSYAIVGPAETADDSPIITAESAFEAIHEDDPVTKSVRHGIKQWTEDGDRFVTYYHRDGRTTWYKKKSGPWVEDREASTTHEHKMCSLVPLPHQGRLLGRVVKNFDQRLGRPVFADIVPVMDALNKIGSDMMVSAEFHALPRRYATGLKEDEFLDEVTGKQMEIYSMIAGRMWASEEEKAKFGQFPEADLQNFHNTIKLLMQIVAMQLGLPSHYLTFMGDNPPSADAIRSSEAQLVKRAERLQQAYGVRWRQIMRLALLEQGKKPSEIKRLEVVWRDPSTPTVAQKADAIVKLVQARDGRGRSVVPIEQAREDMGYTAEQRKRMADYDDNVNDPIVAAQLRSVRRIGGEISA